MAWGCRWLREERPGNRGARISREETQQSYAVLCTRAAIEGAGGRGRGLQWLIWAREATWTTTARAKVCGQGSRALGVIVLHQSRPLLG